MKHRLINILFFVLISVGICSAQSTLFKLDDDGHWQKATTTHRLAEFPKIHQDGRVWFRFKAPSTAQSVKIHMGSDEVDMQKDEKASGI